MENITKLLNGEPPYELKISVKYDDETEIELDLDFDGQTYSENVVDPLEEESEEESEEDPEESKTKSKSKHYSYLSGNYSDLKRSKRDKIDGNGRKLLRKTSVKSKFSIKKKKS